MEIKNKQKILKYTYHSSVHLFAVVGAFFIFAFILNRFNLTKNKSEIDPNSDFISKALKSNRIDGLVLGDSVNNLLSLAEINSLQNKIEAVKKARIEFFCKITTINNSFGANAELIVNNYKSSKSDKLAIKMINAVESRLQTNSDFKSKISKCEDSENNVTDYLTSPLEIKNHNNIFFWSEDEVGKTLLEAIKKDKDQIYKAATLAHVEPRTIVAIEFAEQSRLFRTQRGLFKSYLKPLQILASANQFSLGVMGVKPKTAEAIEKHLKDSTSPYYLGAEYENLLDLPNKNTAGIRYNRLSDEHDHFYSYLYGALCIKQLQTQWQKTGKSINYRPEIVATLYNIGFDHSVPNDNPQVGGAEMELNGESYTFGRLAYEFYYSGILADEFPFQ